jgi:hypothetical protein
VTIKTTTLWQKYGNPTLQGHILAARVTFNEPHRTLSQAPPTAD